MIRRSLMMTVVALAVLGAMLAPTARAQGAATCVINLALAEPTVDTESDSDDEAFEPDALESAELHADGHVCARAQTYPGPFTNRPTPVAGPYAVPFRIVAAPAPAVEQRADAAGADAEEADRPAPLAHSGSESAVLAYFGTGLVAFGAAALGTRRRYLDAD